MKQSLLVVIALCATAAAQPVMQPTMDDGPPSECPPSPPPTPAPVRVTALAPLTPAPADKPQQWLVLGAIADEHGTLYGGRAQLDVLTHGPWSLGLAGAYRSSATTSDAATHSNASLYLAGTTTVGPLLVRAQLGAGVAFVDAGTGQMSIGGGSTSPIAEGALLVGLPLGADWLLVGGPIVDAALSDRAQTTNVTLFAGLGRRF